MNKCSRTPYRTFTNTIERTRPLFMFVHLTNRMEFLVHVRSFIKRTNINELPAERFTNCSLNVRFVYSPTWASRCASRRNGQKTILRRASRGLYCMCASEELRR
ncbi:hypothetical protein Hanom_Chr14g01331601 [Helianthus anomalus]